MTRATFIRRLRALCDLPVPKGHARTNKGVTTYFFPHEEIEEIARLLLDEVSDAPQYDPTHVPITLTYRSQDKERCVQLHIQCDFVSVAIVRWPA